MKRLPARQRFCDGWSKWDAAADSPVTRETSERFFQLIFWGACVKFADISFYWENIFNTYEKKRPGRSIGIKGNHTHAASNFRQPRLWTGSFLDGNERNSFQQAFPRRPRHPWLVLRPTMMCGTAARHINLAARTGLIGGAELSWAELSERAAVNPAAVRLYYGVNGRSGGRFGSVKRWRKERDCVDHEQLKMSRNIKNLWDATAA